MLTRDDGGGGRVCSMRCRSCFSRSGGYLGSGILSSAYAGALDSKDWEGVSSGLSNDSPISFNKHQYL